MFLDRALKLPARPAAPKNPHTEVEQRAVVTLDPRPRRTEDGIEILPARVFAEQLWADELLA